MFFQTDVGVEQHWARTGCFLSSGMFWAEREEGCSFKPADSINIYNIVLPKKIIDEECTLLSPNAFMATIESQLRFILDPATGSAKRFSPNDQKLKSFSNGKFIGEWYWTDQNGTEHTHFSPVDHDLSVLMDVYSPAGSRTIANGNLKNIRVLL